MKTKAERKAIEDRIQKIADKHGGRITPDLVVADAKNKNSPLHGEFEWDVRKAAQAHWIDQARALIASVTVIVRTTTVDVRSPAYVRDPNRSAGEQGYISVDNLRSDSDAARSALVSEFTRVGDLLRRARILARALEMEDQVERLVRGVDELREHLQRPAAGPM